MMGGPTRAIVTTRARTRAWISACTVRERDRPCQRRTTPELSSHGSPYTRRDRARPQPRLRSHELAGRDRPRDPSFERAGHDVRERTRARTKRAPLRRRYAEGLAHRIARSIESNAPRERL